MKTLIRKCGNLQELNVLNSALTLAHFRDVLDTLRKLKTVFVAITRSGSETFRLGEYPSIRKMYVEFIPSSKRMDFVVRFLERCTGVEYLHLCIAGDSDDVTPAGSSSLSAERLSRYQTIILSTELQDCWHVHDVIAVLFHLDHSIRDCLVRRASMDDTTWYERKDAERREILSLQYRKRHLTPDDLIELPDLCSDRPLGLRVAFPYRGLACEMPEMSRFSSVVELDLTRCHVIYTEKSWWSLVNASPAIEVLAIPLCSVTLPRSSDRYSLPLNVDSLKTLTKLKLRKFYVEALFSSLECRWCLQTMLTKEFMNIMSDFECLEELQLNNINPHPNFLESVERPFSMTTVKFHLHDNLLDRALHLGRYRKFLLLCRNLKYFKLSHSMLTLNSAALWDAFCVSNLKQLCVSTSRGGAIDTQVIGPKIQHLLKTLDVFHIHVAPRSDAGEFFSFIDEAARRANLMRGANPIRVVHTKLLSGTIAGRFRVPCFPGRGLCTVGNFIGTVKPIGWDIC